MIANKANFLYTNNNDTTSLDAAATDDIKQFIMKHPGYRRRPIIVTRPHSDHETNKNHQLTSSGEIMTAARGSDPSR